MSKSKTLISVLLFGAIALFIAGAIVLTFLFPSSYVDDDSQNYKIQSLETTINVNKDNTLNITENYVVNFPQNAPERSHGLYRAIPLTNKMQLTKDGTSYNKNYNVTISNVTATQPYNEYIEDDYYIIKLGNPSFYANETETYSISYTMAIPNDRITDFDLFYFNVLGNFWNTTIANFSTKITFFESVESQKESLKIYKGTFGSTSELSSSNVTFSNDNKTLSITASNLGVGEGITVQMFFENNYFDVDFSNSLIYLGLGLIIAVAILSIYLYIKHNNKSTVVPVVQFKPSSNFTSADIGYIMDKKVDKKDIASLIVYWAQKGFIKIIEEGDKTYIQKLQNADDSMKNYEKIMFNAIFKDKETEKVEIKSIGEKFATSYESVKKEIETENSTSFNKNAVNSRNSICLLSGVVFGVVFYILNTLTCQSLFAMCSVVVAFCLIFYFAFLSEYNDKKLLENSAHNVLFIVLSLLLVVALVVFAYFTFESFVDTFYVGFLTVVFIAFEMLIICKFNVRSDEGIKHLGDIIGLKNFIATAEKSRLEMLCKNNPEIFYEILPYAYVLGVYNDWCKKFEGIVIQTPTWYSGNDDMMNSIFWIHILNTSCLSFERGIDLGRIANSSRSGSGIGGGFSGGGFGGGGGGRW